MQNKGHATYFHTESVQIFPLRILLTVMRKTQHGNTWRHLITHGIRIGEEDVDKPLIEANLRTETRQNPLQKRQIRGRNTGSISAADMQRIFMYGKIRHVNSPSGNVHITGAVAENFRPDRKLKKNLRLSTRFRNWQDHFLKSAAENSAASKLTRGIPIQMNGKRNAGFFHAYFFLRTHCGWPAADPTRVSIPLECRCLPLRSGQVPGCPVLYRGLWHPGGQC